MEIKVFTKAMNYWRRLKRERWLKQLRTRNNNHSFSLITNDCIGGVIYHDLGEQFRSPTVNLWIPNNNFLEFAQNLEYYLSCDLMEKTDSSKPYPVGMIVPSDDKHSPIEINFMHYSSFEEGVTKWKERCARVDYQQLFFIWHFYDEKNTEDIEIFDRWDARKMAIVHAPVSSIRNCKVTTCYDHEPHNGKILDVIDRTGRRYLDEIDYVGWLNNSGE